MAESISDNIDRLRERIAQAAERVGRAAEEITLVAVTKTVPVERIREAAAAGQVDFGENYYQEAREKLPLFGPEVRWHFIGHLQSNKAGYVAGRFALIQSVDSVGLARKLGAAAQAAGTVQPILIEVKLDEEATKFGIDPERALELAAEAAELPGLALQGLMGMASFTADKSVVRAQFAKLRSLFDRLPAAQKLVLSMGMTGDFEPAIEEGSTMVRIGTAIFGARA